jgi:hypothetical protein
MEASLLKHRAIGSQQSAGKIFWKTYSLGKLFELQYLRFRALWPSHTSDKPHSRKSRARPYPVTVRCSHVSANEHGPQLHTTSSTTWALVYALRALSDDMVGVSLKS